MESALSEGLVRPERLTWLESVRSFVTCGPEDTWVAEAVASSEGLHHAVNLLGLTR